MGAAIVIAPEYRPLEAACLSPGARGAPPTPFTSPLRWATRGKREVPSLAEGGEAAEGGGVGEVVPPAFAGPAAHSLRDSLTSSVDIL